MRFEPKISTLAAALLAAFGITIPFAARPATVVVTTTGDSGTGADCTLRQAIVSMNNGAVSGTGCANTGAGFGSADTINFDIIAFPPGGANTVSLANGQLSISTGSLTIDATANGNVTIDANQASRVMLDSASVGFLNLYHLTLTNGKSTSADCFGNIGGGGICSPLASLTLTHCSLAGNSADNGAGGGIYSRYVTLTNSTLTGNSAVNGAGGGIYSQYVTLTNSTLTGNSAGSGGGILTRGGNITGSTLSGNSASLGGGINNVQGALVLTNSTLSGNSAQSASFGGGGILVQSGTLTLTNDTISSNDAYNFGAGIYAFSATIIANNSILAGNTISGVNMGHDVQPGIDYGLDDLIGGDPKLAPLASNGGSTQTMLPLPGSPAIDNGSDAICAASPVNGVDQRGIPRPQGAGCDIGAVETDTIFASGFE